MENSLQRLNDIMKPYFDKKQQMEDNVINLDSNNFEAVETVNNLKNERIEHGKKLEKELENLKSRTERRIKDFESKKAREIEEYISNSANSDFFVGYGSMLIKDLEKEYDKQLQRIKEESKKREDQLLQEIEILKSNNDNKKIENPNSKLSYKIEDLKELRQVKLMTRERLIKYQNELNVEQMNLENDNAKLLNLKNQYENQIGIINGQEWINLYKEIDKNSDKINKIKETFKKVEEFLNLMKELPEEIIKIENTPEIDEKEEIEEKKLDNMGLIDQEENEDFIETLYDVETPYFEENGGATTVENKKDLLKMIYNDIVSSIYDLRTVKLNPSKGMGEINPEFEYYVSTRDGIDGNYKLSKSTLNLYDEMDLQLPNGEYINQDDFNKALKKYYNKFKGLSYKVKETEEKYIINNEIINKYKKVLKKCSALKLIRDKKISSIDIVKVYGKSKADKLFRESELGILYGIERMPEGEYINKYEAIAAINNAISKNGLYWLKGISQRLKDGINSISNSNQNSEEIYENNNVKQK